MLEGLQRYTGRRLIAVQCGDTGRKKIGWLHGGHYPEPGSELLVECASDCCRGLPLEMHKDGGRLFRVGEFEQHGGYGAWKNWQDSIKVLPVEQARELGMVDASGKAVAEEGDLEAEGQGPGSSHAGSSRSGQEEPGTAGALTGQERQDTDSSFADPAREAARLLWPDCGSERLRTFLCKASKLLEARHSLVGRPVWVFWLADNEWYKGRVAEFHVVAPPGSSPRGKPSWCHIIEYDDGDMEDLKLSVELFSLEAPPDWRPQEHGAEAPPVPRRTSGQGVRAAGEPVLWEEDEFEEAEEEEEEGEEEEEEWEAGQEGSSESESQEEEEEEEEEDGEEEVEGDAAMEEGDGSAADGVPAGAQLQGSGANTAPNGNAASQLAQLAAGTAPAPGSGGTKRKRDSEPAAAAARPAAATVTPLVRLEEQRAALPQPSWRKSAATEGSLSSLQGQGQCKQQQQQKPQVKRNVQDQSQQQAEQAQQAQQSKHGKQPQHTHCVQPAPALPHTPQPSVAAQAGPSVMAPATPGLDHIVRVLRSAQQQPGAADAGLTPLLVASFLLHWRGLGDGERADLACMVAELADAHAQLAAVLHAVLAGDA